MHVVSYTNTHRDVTDLINHGMVKHTERNIIFLRNKKKVLIYASDGAFRTVPNVQDGAFVKMLSMVL